MKTFAFCILAAALALNGVWGPAPAANLQDQPTEAGVWSQALGIADQEPVPTDNDWDPEPTDSVYPVSVRLDKKVYSTEDTVIKAELLGYSWDTEPDIVEIVWLDTGSVVFYGEAREASLTIDIDLHPGEYLLRVRRGMDWDTYWSTYWDDWNEDLDVSADGNGDAGFVSAYAQFSVAGPSDLFRLKGKAEAELEQYPETRVLLSARLEWDGLSGEGPYTVTQIDEKYEQGKVTHIKGIHDGHAVVSGLLSGGVYTFTVSNGEKTSNPIVIDLSGIPPLEYAGNKNNKVLILKIGDPYMYTVDDAELADAKKAGQDEEFLADESNWEAIELIDKKNRGVVPVIANNRTMMPVSRLVEIMGGQADWNAAARLVTIKLWDNTLEIPIGSQTVLLNGQERTFDTPAQIEQSRTLVPIWHLKLLKCDVNWNETNRSVLIRYPGGDNGG